MSLLAPVIRPGPASDGCFTDNIGKLVTSWVLHTALPPGILMGSADKLRELIALLEPLRTSKKDKIQNIVKSGQSLPVAVDT